MPLYCTVHVCRKIPVMSPGLTPLVRGLDGLINGGAYSH